MRIALDESGSFSLVSSGPTPPVSVAVTVIVPDDERDGVFEAYRSFRARLEFKELRDGEPKGGRLTEGSRQLYCELLDCFPRVQVCPCIIDLGQFPSDTAANLRDELSHDLLVIADSSTDAAYRYNLRAVSSQIANLSPNQGLRLYTWARSFFHGLYHAILTPDAGDTLTEWDDREFFIDPVQDKAGSEEESIFCEMLSLWMMCWASHKPFHLLDEDAFPRNSFRSRFSHGDRINMEALLSGRVRFDRASNIEELLQIADIAASIVYRAARNPAAADAIAMYERLMSACPYEPDFGIGLVTPHRELSENGRPNRFAPLVAAMERTYRAGKGRCAASPRESS